MKHLIPLFILLFLSPAITVSAHEYLATTDSVHDLEEFVITSERPQFVQKDGKFIYDNLGSILETRVVSSAHALLLELPLITSTDGSSPKLSGAPLGSTVFLNGKPSQMSQSQLLDYLKNIPADQVKNIEIIYNPSPKWRTRGAVINVVLKKARRWTVNGMGQATAVNKHVNTANAGLSMTANFGRPTVNMMYSYDRGRGLEKSVTLARHNVGGIIHNVADTSKTRLSSPHHNIYAGVSYDLNAANSLDINYYGMFNPGNSSSLNNLNSEYGRYLTRNESRSNLNSVMATYSNTKGVQAGIEYSHYSLRSGQDVYHILPGNPEMSFAQNSSQTVNSLRGYADFSTSLPRQWRLVYGLKFNYNKNSNRLDNIHSSEDMEGESSKSDTEETIGSVYVGTSRYFFNNKLYASASVSAEHNKLGRYSTFQILPNVSLTFIPNYTHIFQATYTTYNSFPSFWQRQEYVSYSSPYNLSLGNPTLKPARYHVASLLYALKNKYVASLSYYRVNNFFLDQTYLSPSSLVQITQLYNIDYSSVISLNVSVPLSVGKVWYPTVVASLDFERCKSSDWHGLPFDKKGVGCIINLNNSLNLSKRPLISINVDAMYRSSSLAGLWERPHQWMLNAGVSAAFLDERLTVDFRADDILETLIPLHRMRLGTQWLDSDINFYNRSFSIKIAYRFKGYKEFKNRTPDTSRLGMD